MIDFCDTSFIDRRFAGERVPLSHQLPAPSGYPVSGLQPDVVDFANSHSPEVRSYIKLRDQRWRELSAVPVPSELAVGTLRTTNDAVIQMLAATPPPFSDQLAHVELLLCKLCTLFLARCDLEIEASKRRAGDPSLTPQFLLGSLRMALAPEEDLQPPIL